MKAKLMNKTVSVVEYQDDESISGMGEITKVLTTIASGVKCRITRNKEFGNDEKIDKFISSSTHIIFFIYGRVDLLIGRFIKTSTGEMYEIKYNDKEPGGVVDSHNQVYCILSSVLEES